MAFKAKKPGGSKTKKKKSTQPFFLNEKFRFILGIFVLLVSAYLLIAFVSYLFYGAADQSKLDLPWKELVLKSDIKVDNKAGKTGAFLSEHIMNRGFGIASFLFVYLLVVTGLKILGRNLVKYQRALVFSLLLIIWISVTLGFVFPKTDSASFINPGGQYGFVLSNWLSSLVGKAGLVIILFISILSILVIRFEKAYTPYLKICSEKKKKPKRKKILFPGNLQTSWFLTIPFQK
jgi:DNA segregation ATPase FtsK/SpoIIIE, S-DNA-T family